MKTLIFLTPIALILFACASSVEDVSQEPVVTADKLVSQTERLEVEITNTPNPGSHHSPDVHSCPYMDP